MPNEKIIHSYLLIFAGQILDNSTKDLKFAFTNLTPFTVYDVYVAAETSAGIGPKSNISVFTPPEGKNIFFSVFIRCFTLLVGFIALVKHYIRSYLVYIYLIHAISLSDYYLMRSIHVFLRTLYPQSAS